MNTTELVATIVGGLSIILGPTGAAWAGVKLGFNGLKKSIANTEIHVKEIDAKVDKLTEGQAKHGERIAIVETKIDNYHSNS